MVLYLINDYWYLSLKDSNKVVDSKPLDDSLVLYKFTWLENAI